MREAAAQSPRISARAWGMLIALSLLWGGSFFFVGVAVHDIPTFTLVLYRVGFAAIALLFWLRLRGESLPSTWTFWRPFAIMSLLNNVIPFSLIVWGQAHIASGLASILNATTPFFTVILASAVVAEERLSANRVVGILIGIVGVAILIGPGVFITLGDHLWAQLACIAAAISYAAAGVFARKSPIFKHPPSIAATAQLTAATVLLLPMVLLVDGVSGFGWQRPSVLAAVLGLSLAATAVAYILYFYILRSAGAVNLLLVTFLVPVGAVFLGILFLGESLTGMQILGAAGIALALAIIDGRLFAAWTR